MMSRPLFKVNDFFTGGVVKNGHTQPSPPYLYTIYYQQPGTGGRKTQICLCLLLAPSLGFVKSIGLQQIKDQSHQFTGCKRKGTFLGKFLRLRFFFA